MTQLTFFNSDETVAFVRNDAISAVHHQDEYYLEASFCIDPEKPIVEDMYVGYVDRDGQFNLFIIETPSTDYINKSVSFQANLAAMVELQDYVIEDRRPSNCQAGLAVSVALENTDWSLGIAEDTIIASSSFYYQSPWEALLNVAETYRIDLRFRASVSDAGITGRYVDVVNDAGRDVGLRLEVGKNLNSLIVEVDSTSVRTALYGRGKGEEVGVNSYGDATYGRRIDFADLEWSVENGDPCNKPAGQKYVEDEEATKLYGRKGRPRFGVVVFEDCEDEEELINLTWEYLQTVKSPKVTVKTSVRILEQYFGYDGEAIRYRDHATVILDDNNHIQARVATASVDLVDEGRTEVTIGNAVSSIADMQASNTLKIQNASEQIRIGSSIATKNPDLLQGIINTMVTQIMSSGTKMYTDPKDGSFIYESDDGTSAVKLTGSGILVSNEKIDGEFNWSTAIDGSGISASVINSGVLNASIVKILGTDRFYWDSQAIFILDTEDANKQIRIGMYDGKNYGIGYTQDGGQTWQNAIGFDGVVLGSGSVTKENLGKDVIELIGSMRGIESITEYYLVSASDSGVTAASEGWTTDVQTMTPENRYLWNREVIFYSDKTTFESSPVVIGAYGQSGSNGTTYYTWVKYADSPTSGMSDIPEGKAYIGLAYNKGTSTESTDYGDYEWSLIKGNDGKDGIPGTDGKDGTTYYTWVKYADDASGSNMSDDPTGKYYIGFAYNKSTPDESDSASDYRWSLFRGSDGVDGDPGKDGVGIRSVVNMYGLSASATEIPTTWSENAPDTDDGMLYLWVYEVITYTDDSSSQTNPRISAYLGSESIVISDTEPENPAENALWLDTGSTPATLKRYDSVDGWEECTVSRAELDNMSKRISEHDSKFIVMDEKISAKVSQTDYVTDMAGKANSADVEAQFSAAAELNAKNLILKFTEAKNYTDDKTASFDSFIEEVKTYIEFGITGLILGKVGSSFKTQITNEKMSFLQDNEEVAYIQYNRMYITEARVTDRLSIGTEENGYFDWVTLADGLGLKWK